MAWSDQNPEATNVLLSGRVITRKNKDLHFEIDKLSDGTYRATVGNLFGSQEVIRNKNIEIIMHSLSNL